MKVIPAPGRAVRDPKSMMLLPAEGREVPDNDTFWTRRLRDGDVTARRHRRDPSSGSGTTHRQRQRGRSKRQCQSTSPIIRRRTGSPACFVEIDPSQANTGVTLQSTLLIGQKTAAGTAVVDTPVEIQSSAQVLQLCGQGSILATMAQRYMARDPFGDLWLLPARR